MNNRLGCISLVPINSKEFLAIQCAKGRGIILPGGKIEKSETFYQAAARELKEETSATAYSQKLIFQAHNIHTEYYVYCFLTDIIESYDSIIGYKSNEGEVVSASWDTLLTSQFRSYYELLRDCYVNLA